MIDVTMAGCIVRRWSLDYLETVFPDGTSTPALFGYGEAQRALARSLGYGDDVRAMHLDHEVGHTVLAEAMGWPHSPVLRAVAVGRPRIIGGGAEEARVLALQRFLRTGSMSSDLPQVDLAWTTKRLRRVVARLNVPVRL